MNDSRLRRPTVDPFQRSLLTVAAAHGLVLPARLRLLALLIAVAIAVGSAVFGQPASDDAEPGHSDRQFGHGRFGSYLPSLPEAE